MNYITALNGNTNMSYFNKKKIKKKANDLTDGVNDLQIVFRKQIIKTTHPPNIFKEIENSNSKGQKNNKQIN